MSKNWTAQALVVGLTAFISLSVGTASAAEDRARADFINNCAACHGVDGTGNGPMEGELKSKPADLTALTKNNGSDFPYLNIRRIIDGSIATGKMRSHGSKEMPIWGDVFRRESISDQKWTDAQARIMNIVDYIASIQK
jgi:mono/diheme cytochrome c family protein